MTRHGEAVVEGEQVQTAREKLSDLLHPLSAMWVNVARLVRGEFGGYRPLPFPPAASSPTPSPTPSPSYPRFIPQRPPMSISSPLQPASDPPEIAFLEKAFHKIEVSPDANKILKLRWDDQSIRRAVLFMVVKKLENYLLGPRQYSFDDHYDKFARRLDTLNIRPPSLTNWTRQRKAFLLACVNAIYQERFPAEAAAARISLEAFKAKFLSVIEFMSMNNEEWTVAHDFTNHMLVALTLVPATKNKYMLLESCALLVGIAKCLQGSPGRDIKRFLLIFEHISTPGGQAHRPGGKAIPDSINEKRPLDEILKGRSLADVLAAWVRCNPESKIAGTKVRVGNDTFRIFAGSSPDAPSCAAPRHSEDETFVSVVNPDGSPSIKRLRFLIPDAVEAKENKSEWRYVGALSDLADAAAMCDPAVLQPEGEFALAFCK